MGLDAAIEGVTSDSGDEEEQDNPFSVDDDPENPVCPECENEGEDSGYWYYRCNTPESECRVMTFIIPDR